MPVTKRFRLGSIVNHRENPNYRGGRVTSVDEPETIWVVWPDGVSSTIHRADTLVLAAPEVLPAEPDMVNHPPHYTSHPKGIECIEVIEDASDLRLGTAIKYIWRVLWGSKGRDVEDIEKAVWYLNRWLAEKKGAQS